MLYRVQFPISQKNRGALASPVQLLFILVLPCINSPPALYSLRSASMGFSFAARFAGM